MVVSTPIGVLLVAGSDQLEKVLRDHPKLSIRSVASLEAAELALQETTVDVVLFDLRSNRTPDYRLLKAANPLIPMIVVVNDETRAAEAAAMGVAFAMEGELTSSLFDARIEQVIHCSKTLSDCVESELRVSDSLYSSHAAFLGTLIDAIPSPVFYQDLKGRFLGCNSAFEQLSNTKEEELVGLTLVDLWPDQYTSKFAQMARELLCSPGSKEYEVALPMADGALREHVIFESTIHDAAGEVVGLIAVFLDITNRKALERERDLFLYDTMERLRELRGLYEAARVVAESRSLEELFESISSLIPRSWHYPKITRARVVMDGRVYGGSFEPTGWKQTANIVIKKEVRGVIEVYLLEERPDLGEGPFLPEEQRLLGALADIVAASTSRIETESSLQEYHNIVESSLAVVFLWRNEEGWPVEQVSENVKQLFGRPASDFLTGRVSYAEVIHPDDLLRVGEEVTTYSEDREFFVHEPYRILTESGVRWIDDRTSIRRDGKGQITHYQGVVLDITERMETEQALRESEERYHDQSVLLHTLLESIPTPVFFKDRDLRYVGCNEAFERLTQRTKEEIIGQHSSDLWPDRLQFEEEEGFQREIEFKLPSLPDGAEKNLVLHQSSYLDSSGNLAGFTGVLFDVSDRKQAERELQLHRDHLEEVVNERTNELREEVAMRKEAEASALEALEESERIFQTAANGMRVVSPDFTVLRANRAFVELTGYSAEEIIGSKCYETFPGSECHHPGCSLIRTHRGEFVSQYEVLKTSRDGLEHLCVMNATPLLNEEGRFIAMVEDFRDLTETRRLESIAQAVVTMDTISYAFSGILHELGNPINTLKTTLSVMKRRIDGFSKKKIADYMDRSLDDIDRVESLLKSLKSFNMYERMDVRPIQLNRFFSEFSKLVELDATKRSIRFSYDVDPDDPWVLADQRALQQIMLNLVANAEDAVAEGPSPQVCVEVTSDSSYAKISVRDNGIGIEEERQSDLFKPFHTTKPKGTGLGLVITKKMVVNMKGSIEVTSAPKVGTTVVVMLPIAR